MRVSSVPQRSARRSAKIAAFRQYQQLSRSFVTVNEKICQLRPVEDTLTPEEKNGRGDPAGGRPGNRPPADGHFGRLAQDGQRRLGSRRDAVGDCMHQVGAATLSHLLRLSGPRPATIACLRPASPFSTTHGRNNCSPSWDGSIVSGHTMFVRTATRDTFPAMRNWTWRGRNARRACVG